MTKSSPQNFPPALLVATDLSPRCDRALNRALQLAQAWQSRLTALHVYDAPSDPDQILAWAADDPDFDLRRDAARELRLDLAPLGDRADLRLVQAKRPVDVIDRIAAEVDAGLVVTGVARDEPLGRFALGSNVEALARTLRRPLLIVRSRVRATYRRIAVATDLSDGSRAALVAAARWFPEGELHLFHALQRAPSLGDAAREADSDAVAATRGRCEQFVAAADLPAGSVCDVVVGEGPLESALTRYVRERHVDLVAIGGSQSTGLLDLLFGNSLEKLLQWLPCDVLVVPHV